MMMPYRSAHPNAVHQLNAAVSKHYYAGKDGLLKYQVKPMEVKLTGLADASRRHMLVYTLRDHSSGVFYAEVSFTPGMASMTGFLARAWGSKADYPFCGLPTMLTLPRTVTQAFSGLGHSLEQLGIGLLSAGSGFAGGIGDIKVVESSLCISDGWSVDRVQPWVRKTCIDHALTKGRTGNCSKLAMWQQAVPALRLPPSGWGL